MGMAAAGTAGMAIAGGLTAGWNVIGLLAENLPWIGVAYHMLNEVADIVDTKNAMQVRTRLPCTVKRVFLYHSMYGVFFLDYANARFICFLSRRRFYREKYLTASSTARLWGSRRMNHVSFNPKRACSGGFLGNVG